MDVTVPNLELVNNLYIYPELLNFTKHKDSNSRNISIKIEFKENDQNIDEAGLPVIYGKSSTLAFRPFARTPVIYHKKNPSFTEEIKIKLPTVITPNSHILFTFSHVICQAKGKASEVENILGYVAIPFLVDNKYVY